MKFSRRDAIKLIVAGSAASGTLEGHAKENTIGRQSLRWNSDWRFFLDAHEASDPVFSAADFDDSKWETVQLPHWGRLEAYDVSQHFQGLCWYRKVLHPGEAMRGRRGEFACEAAMQVADVWVNGTHRLQHVGGYLPFRVDLTRDVERGGPVVIAVRLDNRDNPSVPPGKPLAKMDFCYFSGMYRNVSLESTGPLYISDAVSADQVAGGGVFFRCTSAAPGRAAEVEVATHVINGQDKDADRVQAVSTLSTAEGLVVARGTSGAVRIGARNATSIVQKLTVEDAEFWSPENPRLYDLRVQIVSQAGVVDQVVTRVGIRWLVTDRTRGFFLNGEHRVPSGANRHQAYPYIGNALSDEAQYRDAKRLKDGGFELIRLSHYPQSPAFLDACDELGLMVIACIPGWQHFEDSEEFKGRVVQNLRDTIRRDRNHPCVVLWETALNETYGHDLFFHELVETAKAEYPGSQMLTCGDAEGHDFDVIRYDVPYSGWDDATNTRPNRAHGAMSLHREYGDNQFGAYSRYSRGDGELLMLVQAWNYQTAMNQQLQLSYTWGQCIWEGIDNNRGMDPKIATCGALDLFRLPKFMYEFYRSQTPRDARAADGNAVVFIANYWTENSPGNVVVFSNADEVELSINGRPFRRQGPDHGEDTPFGDGTGFDQTYWLKSAAQPHYEERREVKTPIYNGGNCKALTHPPFTFRDVPFESGEVKAVGYRNGSPVGKAVRRTSGRPHRVEIIAALDGKPFHAGGDVIVVHASIVDENGTVVPGASMLVRFHVEGSAVLIGDNPRAAEAGIASILLRSQKEAGTVDLTAKAEGLLAGQLRVTMQRPRRTSSI